MSNQATGSLSKPAYVTALEEAYGAPSQEAFGSAVFYEQLEPSDDLEAAALRNYKYFAGDLWKRYGEEAWMSTWKEAYRRPEGATHDIQAELAALEDRETRMQVDMILNNVDQPEQAQAALADAFDAVEVNELRAYNIGDGEAMSGILIAGRRAKEGETTFLAFLLD